MKEKIQPYVIEGKGTATEAKFEVQSRLTTQNRAILYYDLRDPNGTTTAYDTRIQQHVTLPYAILFRSKIVLTGDDRAAVLADSTFASNIVFRDRTDIIKDTADTNTYKYFAIVNKMSKTGRNSGRRKIDGNGYELYEKQSAAREASNNYTFITSYAGDITSIPIFDSKGNIVGYDGQQLTYGYGAGIIDVNVTISNAGQKSYAVDPNSRGDEFYINLVQPYL